MQGWWLGSHFFDEGIAWKSISWLEFEFSTYFYQNDCKSNIFRIFHKIYFCGFGDFALGLKIQFIERKAFF